MVNENILAEAIKQKRAFLTETESKQLLKEAGIDVVETHLATSPQEAVSIASKIGFPAVLKIVSTGVIHKSDSGGVKLGLETPEQVAAAYEDIIKAIKKGFPNAEIQGISVQKMARPGVEVIIGMSKDPQFGPVIMFGLGGVWVELLKDVSFRITPLATRDAREMIEEIKGYPLLTGYRGQEPADLKKLEDFILKVSVLAENNPRIKEMDLNPVFAYSDGAVAVDARIILEDGE